MLSYNKSVGCWRWLISFVQCCYNEHPQTQEITALGKRTTESVGDALDSKTNFFPFQDSLISIVYMRRQAWLVVFLPPLVLRLASFGRRGKVLAPAAGGTTFTLTWGVSGFSGSEGRTRTGDTGRLGKKIFVYKDEIKRVIILHGMFQWMKKCYTHINLAHDILKYIDSCS